MMSLNTRSLFAVLAVSLFATLGFAAKECVTDTGAMPGVNAEGNIDGGLEGQGTGKLCVNTKNGKFTVKINGTVPNESNATQNFKDSFDLEDFFGVPEADRSKYHVSKKGKAKFTAKGTFVE